MALDSGGNAYVTGWTTGGITVTPDAFETAPLGLDAFVSKVNPAGSALVYSTYLGGSCTVGPDLAGDAGWGIAIDGSGDAFVAGQACSPDFPVTSGAIQTAMKSTFFNAFLSELDPSGTTLLYSTYIGGSSYAGDWAFGVGVDPAGNAYIGGLTHSTDLPVVAGSFQLRNIASDQGTGFVSKFTIPAGQRIVHPDFGLAVSPATLTWLGRQAQPGHYPSPRPTALLSLYR